MRTFVLEADGDLATALETYTAERLMHWSKTKLQGINRSDLAIDMFLTAGQVNHQTVLDHFVQSKNDLSPTDLGLVKSWKDTFNGLFCVIQATAEGDVLINWLTEKHYSVQPNGLQSQEALSRLSPGEIVVARLSPLAKTHWTFSGPLLLLGKLGKPKLAVAIGNFKQWFPDQLYGDAPELLEEAWQSVERYHNDFVDFFGGDRVTLSGYELGKKLKDYQDTTTQRHLEAAGLDGSQSLGELVSQADITEEEIEASMAALGEDSRQASGLLKNPNAIKMMMPPIALPDTFRQAEAVTVFVHPRWGQTFLKDYVRLTQLLAATDEASLARLDQLLQKYLQEDGVNAHIWHDLAKEYPQPLEAALRRVLNRPTLALEMLDDVLVEAGKPLTPQLPEIASVPLHLHHLFQEALQEVNQGAAKKKAKGKSKPKTGFAAL
ncbi:MAG: hypothetical protein ACFCVD_22840 [Nodosilinea sp.]